MGARARSGVILLLLFAASGCALVGGGAPAPAPRSPLSGEQARCKVAASHENPLVTEWSSSEKSNLEARLAGGAVAVSYSGCAMHLLPACVLGGKYSWRHTTTASDTIDVRNTDELYAKLPLGAASLEGELAQTGRIAVRTTVSGQLELESFDATSAARSPACREATHVIGAISIGAFQLESGRELDLRGGVSAAGARAGGASGSAQASFRGAGEAASCREATDVAPHPACRSPIQVFLQPLPGSRSEAAPPGNVKVRFLPPDNDSPWDLVVGDRVLCRAPCERWTDPALPYAFRTEGGFMRADPVDDVPDLREFAESGPLEVRTRPRAGGRTALGIVETSVGGVAMLVGTVLIASGCGGKSTGRCVGGAIALPIGAIGVGAGVLTIVNARSRMEVVPMSDRPDFVPRAEQP